MNHLLTLCDQPWVVEQRPEALILMTCVESRSYPLCRIPITVDPMNAHMLSRLFMEAPQMLSVLLALSENYHHFRDADSLERLSAIARTEQLYEEVHRVLLRLHPLFRQVKPIEGNAQQMIDFADSQLHPQGQWLVPSPS